MWFCFQVSMGLGPPWVNDAIDLEAVAGLALHSLTDLGETGGPQSRALLLMQMKEAPTCTPGAAHHGEVTCLPARSVPQCSLAGLCTPQAHYRRPTEELES